jgi:hypothetical protein
MVSSFAQFIEGSQCKKMNNAHFLLAVAGFVFKLFGSIYNKKIKLPKVLENFGPNPSSITPTLQHSNTPALQYSEIRYT